MFELYIKNDSTVFLLSRSPSIYFFHGQTRWLKMLQYFLTTFPSGETEFGIAFFFCK